MFKERNNVTTVSISSTRKFDPSSGITQYRENTAEVFHKVSSFFFDYKRESVFKMAYKGSTADHETKSRHLLALILQKCKN